MDDLALWEAFSSSTVPEKAWNHRAHLRTAWMFLARHGLDEAHLLMRAGIIRLNAFHGLVESPARGYHETLTRVWLTLIAALRKTTPAADSEAFLDACGPMLGKDAVLRHYSRERIATARARAIFVEPDLEPLPSL